MNGSKVFYTRSECVGHFLKGFHLISEQRIPAMGWDGDTKEHRAGWRNCHKTPIAMKVLSKNGGGLIGLALNSADIGVAIDMSKKRILTDLTKVLADALKMFGGEWLIGEGDNLVLQPMITDFGD